MVNVNLSYAYYDAINASAAAIEKSRGVSLKNRAIVFTEDKLTLAIEEALARNRSGTFNTAVYSFSRFLYKNKDGIRVLSKEGSAMAIKKLLLANDKKFACFKKSLRFGNFAPTLYELIAQLKSAKVASTDLSMVADEALKLKIGDIMTAYTLYDEFIEKNSLYDENSFLSLLPEVIKDSREIKNSDVYLVCYSSFTKQSLDAVKALLLTAKSVSFYLVGEEDNENYTNEALSEVCSLLATMRVPFNIIRTESSLNKEAEQIKNKLFTPDKPKRLKSGAVRLYSAYTVDEEAEEIARVIRYNVVFGGKRFNEFSVLVGNLSVYDTAIKNAFRSYEIPYYIDKSMTLADQPLSAFVLTLLDLLRRRDRERLSALYKSPIFFGRDRDIKDEFDNYAVKYRLNYKKLNEKLKYDTDGRLDAFRKKLCAVLDCGKKTDTADGFSSYILSVLTDLNAEETLKELATEIEKTDKLLAAAARRSFDKLKAVLEQISSVLGDSEMGAEEYKSILQSGFAATEISDIPEYADAVYVSDFQTGGYKKKGMLFLAGMSGDVPYGKSDTALLSDKDLMRLEEYNLIIEPKIRIVNERERERVMLGLLGFSSILSVSYSKLFGGKLSRPSDVFTRLIELFTRGKGEPLPVYNKYTRYDSSGMDKTRKNNMYCYRYGALRPSLEQFAISVNNYKYGNIDDITDAASFYAAAYSHTSVLKEIVEGLNTEVAFYLSGESNMSDYLSASEIEDFYSCPYKCFLRHAVDVGEREVGSFIARDNGTFLHAVLEKFVKGAFIEKSARVTSQADSDAFSDKIFDEIKQNEKFAVLFSSSSQFDEDSLRREAKNECFAVYSQISVSDFKPIKTEAKFGYGGDFPPLKLQADGREYKVQGFVDRIDEYNNYIRVIDYKSGKIDGDARSLYAGRKIQLYLYMNAFTGKYKPFGVYYAPLKDDYASLGGNSGDKFIGKTLKDKELILAADRSLGVGHEESDYFEAVVDIDNSGQPIPSFKKYSKFLTEEQFDSYLLYARRLAEQAATELNRGLKITSPLDGECRYCKFKGVCRYDGDVDARTRAIAEDSDKAILSVTEGENAHSKSE